MGKKNIKTLYHYCTLESFLSIFRNSSIWLSDVQKSNDRREMEWFRQAYYDYILEKYEKSADEDIKKICEIIFSLAANDGFEKCPSWLIPAAKSNSKEIVDTLFSLRTYAFCLSEMPDSLGQWRGYANDGKGVAIGFSREYLSGITGYGLRCPKFNFLLGDISYRKDLNSLFDKMFDLHDKTKIEEFVMHSIFDLTHASALYKHPSFKEEKEWRVIYSMEDIEVTKNELSFFDFEKLSSEKYNLNFEAPTIDYIAKDSNIVPHIEIKIKNLNKAIDSIIIGPKCDVSERDIRHVLVKTGAIDSFKDNSIKIIRSDSSYT